MTDQRTLESLITHLSNALGYARLHPPHSSAVQRAVRSVLTTLHACCRERATDALHLRIQGGQFVEGAHLLIGATISGRKLIEVLQRSSAGAVVLSDHLTAEQLTAFLSFALEVAAGPPLGVDEARARLARYGCRNIGLVLTTEKIRWFDGPLTRGQWQDAGIDLGESVATYQGMFENVESSMRRAASGDSIDVNEARSMSERLFTSSKEGFDNVFQLANYPNFDAYTVGHSIRVALLAVYVGSRLGASAEALIEIGAAGLMHDVGKGRIPPEILYKPGGLDEEERRIIAEHPRLGAEILIESEEPSPCALGAAWGHHLRFDGSGYPATHRWARTGRVTSLIQVCDVFEALTAERPYKAAMSPARAYAIMFAQPGVFDPAALSAFTSAMGLYPPGTFVRLSDGRMGRVQGPGETLDRPRVRLLPSDQMLTLSAPEARHLSVSAILSDHDVLGALAPHTAAQTPAAALPARVEAPDPAGTPEARNAARNEGAHDGVHGGTSASGLDSGDCRLC